MEQNRRENGLGHSIEFFSVITTRFPKINLIDVEKRMRDTTRENDVVVDDKEIC